MEKSNRVAHALAGAGLACALAGACTGQVIEGEPDGPFGPGAPHPPTTAPGDLPCEIAELLVDACIACHGSPPAPSVPMSLATHADLLAPAKSNPALSAAELSLERMKDVQNPMPPSGQLAAERIAAFEAWIHAGMPSGSCGGDGGLAIPLACTSNQHWQGGVEGSPLMHPGMPCIGCHSAQDKGPPFLFAGTVYSTVREPNDCAGFAGATVHVTDAQGRNISVTTNAAGNFFFEDDPEKLAFPIYATLVWQGKERKMKDPVSTGDCNTCHTQDGANGSPGRIYLP